MRRGTTPTHIFTFPFNVAECEQIRVLYAQRDNVKLTKEKTDCIISANTLTLKLTQEETFLFDDKDLVEIQIRLKLYDNVIASDLITVRVKKLLEDEVL